MKIQREVFLKFEDQVGFELKFVSLWCEEFLCTSLVRESLVEGCGFKSGS